MVGGGLSRTDLEQIIDATANAAKALLVDSAGVNVTDVTANAVKALLVSAAGSAISTQSIHDSIALAVSDAPDNADVFFGFGEQEITGAQANYDVSGTGQQTQPEPDTGGYTLFAVSSSVEDDTDTGGATPGTGAHVIHVHYLDTSGVEQSTSITMNGTAEVQPSPAVTDCMFVNQHHVESFGDGGGILAAGNIDCLAGSGGGVVSRIAAAGNQSMSTMKQVPAGKTLVVRGWHGYGTAATTKTANLRIRSTAHDGALNAGVYHFHDSARLKDFGSGHIPLQFICPSLSTIKISAWTSGTIDVTGRWAGWLQNN
jgi:hypothetical protein